MGKANGCDCGCDSQKDCELALSRGSGVNSFEHGHDVNDVVVCLLGLLGAGNLLVSLFPLGEMDGLLILDEVECLLDLGKVKYLLDLCKAEWPFLLEV